MLQVIKTTNKRNPQSDFSSFIRARGGGIPTIFLLPRKLVSVAPPWSPVRAVSLRHANSRPSIDKDVNAERTRMSGVLISSKGLSKNFSFWTVSLDLDAMFKIKSLLYKDLILNSRGCRKSNQLLRHPLVVEPCPRRYAFRTAKDVIVQECTSCTFLNFEFALQTRFFCEPLTSCQSSEFATCKLMFSGCHGWHPLNAA